MIIMLMLLLIIQTFSIIEARNPRRGCHKTVPAIIVQPDDIKEYELWNFNASKKPSYSFYNTFLKEKPLRYSFDHDFFNQHYLPMDDIVYRDQSGSVLGSTLSDLVEQLVIEIRDRRKKFTHFIVFKDKDFNYKTLSGLLVLKFKDYPFVVKLSIEHPDTMVKPFSKSVEATGMFIIGGNLRHLSNFTRIYNLENIKRIVYANPVYRSCIDFPRKWYWKPKHGYNLNIQWKLGDVVNHYTIPYAYATISDFICTHTHQPQRDLNKLSMCIAKDTDFLIDPHAGNIVVEKCTNKYVMLDTENFQLMVGLKKKMKSTKYLAWYLELVGTWFKTYCFRLKHERNNDQDYGMVK